MKTKTLENSEPANQNPRGMSPARKTFRVGLSAVVGLLVLFVPLARAVPVQLISARSSAVALPAGGNDNSVAPSLSPDGRFVVFSSTANDLVPGGNNFFSENVFLRDRAGNTTVLVSRSLNNTGGGNGPSLLGQASTNGQFVVFQSDASDLVPNDTNGFTDIFVRDVLAGTTTLVSVSANGSPANGPSTYPVITPDGRHVAFISGASNLVSGDNNGILDVFVRDLVGGTNDLVSVGAVASSSINPVMATPVITPDGRYVAFFSSAASLVSSVPGGSPGEVYLRDRETDGKLLSKTIWASTNAAAMVSAALGLSSVPAYRPQLSDDGRYVAFKAGSLSPTGAVMILRYDAIAAATTAVSTNDLGWYIGPDDNGGPEMTPDGRFIAFARHEGALSLGASSIHVWDAQGAVDTAVSDNGSGVVTNVFSQSPVISPDGQFVAFVSNATNLTGNAISNGFHVYLRNLTASTTQLADVDTNGVGSTDDTMTSLSLSADGRFVAFDSPDGSLVSGDNNHAEDVFVRDLAGGTTELVSPRDATVIPQAANRFSLMSPLSLSADGRWAAFASPADDLVPNDTNKLADIFVRDLVNGTNALASVGFNGSSALGGNSGSAVISADGRYVVFVSSASNLVTGVTRTNVNVFRRDLQAGTTALVSLGSDGVSPGNGDASDPVVSTNGRYVAFLSLANNLAPGATIGMNTYWRDMNLTQTVGLTNGIFSTVLTTRPSLSSDGRYVAYGYYHFVSTLGLKIRDTQFGADIYSNLLTIVTATIDPSGTKIFYQTSVANNGGIFIGGYAVCVDNITPRTNLFSFATQGQLRSPASWSDDGRWLTFVSTTNPGAADDGINKVYLKDFQTGTLSLIGLGGPGLNGAEASSDGPVISGNGRFIAYRSVVTNTVIGDTTAPPNLFLLDRLMASNIVLAAGTAGIGPVPWISRPVISDGGATVAFLNLGSGPATGDFNRAVDIFGAAVDVNAVPVDSDGDGIPDWWMMQYFGHPTGQAGDLSLASDDADGDGVSNLQEYLAGTNPMDPTWRFQLTIAGPSNDKVRLTWLPVAGRNYQVQYKTNLNDPQWLVPTGSIGVLGNLYYYTAPADQTQIFYRVRESN